MPLNRPFIDAHGKRGKPKRTDKKISGKIRFEKYNATHILLRISDDSRPRMVSKIYGMQLAYWLLDTCSTNKG